MSVDNGHYLMLKYNVVHTFYNILGNKKNFLQYLILISFFNESNMNIEHLFPVHSLLSALHAASYQTRCRNFKLTFHLTSSKLHMCL